MKADELQINAILDRVGTILKNHRLEAIAEELGAAPSTASNWKSRGTIPWAELWDFAQRRNVDLVWLLTGKSLKIGTGCDEQNRSGRSGRYEYVLVRYEKIIDAQFQIIERLGKLSMATGGENGEKI